MDKRRVTAMKVNEYTYGKVMERHSENMRDAKYRSMLVSLKPGCFVEAVDGSGGNIVEVIRDRYDIPVQVKTVCEAADEKTGQTIGKHYDHINVEDIYFWEAWDFIAPEYLFIDENAVVGELMFASEVM